MVNDVFENQKFLMYVVNDPTKVEIVKHRINYRADSGAIKIVDNRPCAKDTYYVWQVECPRFEFNDLMRALEVEEGLTEEDLVYRKYES